MRLPHLANITGLNAADHVSKIAYLQLAAETDVARQSVAIPGRTGCIP